MSKILVPLAAGFEEIEAVTIIDVLRRAGLDVITAGIGSSEIVGDHKIKVETDTEITAVDADDLEAVVLPGGMPGAANLSDNNELRNIIKKLNEDNKLCAAICADPIALAAAGILDGRKVTSYPGFDKDLTSSDYQEDRVVIDDNIITGRGPGAAMEFAMALVEYLVDEETKIELKKSMLVNND